MLSIINALTYQTALVNTNKILYLKVKELEVLTYKRQHCAKEIVYYS